MQHCYGLLDTCHTTVINASMESEYLEWLLSGDQPKRRGRGRGLHRSRKVIHDVVQNILDEPIPEEIKKRLLKPLLPRPLPPPRKRKIEKQTGLLREFDPLHAETKRKHDVKWSELVPLLANKLPQYVLSGRAGIMKDYTAAVPIGRHQEADALAFLHAMIPSTTTTIENELQREGGIKFALILEAELEKFSKNGGITTKPFFFHSGSKPILHTSEVQVRLHGAVNKIMERLEGFTNEGSGWLLKRCTTLTLQISRYQPFRGRSYIKTPAYIPPRTVINVKNVDNRCFEWAILSAMYPVDAKDHNPDRPTKYQAHLGELSFRGIDFPVKVTDVGQFEHQNPTLSVSVFGWEKGLYPLHVSKQEGRAIDLLLLVDGNNPQKTHYVWIKDLARMLFKNSAHRHRQHPCRRCLHVFTTPDLLESHKKDCLGIGEKPQRTEMPEEGENILKFTAHHKQMRVPYIIYADFEALNVPVEGCAGDPQTSWTRQIAKQTPCGYCCVVVRSDGEVTGPVLYRGENAVEHFLEAIQNELETINGVFRQPKDMAMTREDQTSFAEAVGCHVCGGPLNGDRVRDHCHITGKYRGAAHNECNLKLRIYPHKTKVPVVFHNLRGYDGHLLMQAIGKTNTKRLAWKKDKTGKWVQMEKTDAINCIPNNMEKYMTFSLGQLQFIDSLQFMNSSLDKLVANLQTENLAITSQSTQTQSWSS
jgi:hypothetical protein